LFGLDSQTHGEFLHCLSGGKDKKLLKILESWLGEQGDYQFVL